MKILFYIFLFIFSASCAQNIIYQDIWRGGVKCQGFSTGLSLNGSQNLDLTIPFGCNIKKVLLTTYSLREPDSTLIKLDGNDVTFESLNLVTINQHHIAEASPIKVYYTDITDLYLSFSDLSNVNVQLKSSCLEQLNCGFSSVGIFIMFEDLFSPLINFTLTIPNKDLIGVENYFIDNLNPINNLFPVAFSIYTDRSSFSNLDGNFVNVNGNLLGLIFGTDIQNINYSGAGPQGNYTFYNLILTGLHDDIPDFQIDSTDALSDISSICVSGQDFLNVNLYMMNTPPSPGAENSHFSIPISYSTDCNSINGIASKDTIICKGETIQLNANGGVNYEWLPQTDLSCSNCSSPIFSGDSSQLYTVRIWANDSCSVVRPVMVKVRQQPQTTSYFQSNTLCGDSTASINWQNLGTNEYSLDNSTFQNSGIFNLVGSGNHTLTIKDTFGCVYDTLISIAFYTTVNSYFTATPTTGEEPLLVQFSESNSNDDGYWWNINGILYPSSLTEFNFINSGSFQISLIAFQNDSACTDTSSITIVVYNDLTLTIPNVITANNDGVNDSFEIIGLDNFPNNELFIFNRWGNEVFHMVNYDNSWNGECKNGFGKKDELPTVTYYYILNAEGIESVHGFIWLQR